MIARLLIFLLIFAPFQGMADTCDPPGMWPIGHEDFEFADGEGTIYAHPGGGFDDTHHQNLKAHEPLKEGLTQNIRTFQVGLPGTTVADDLTPWPAGASCNWTITKLNNAGVPKISITADPLQPGVDTTDVFFVNGYDLRDCTVYIKDDVKIVIYGSAFTDLRMDGNPASVWIIDSLIDQVAGSKGPLRGMEANYLQGCTTHVLHSEMIGGLDSSKVHNAEFYKNHFHGSMNVDAGHNDALQINGPSHCALILKNNVDFLFRQTNAPMILANAAEAGIVNTRVVGNLIGGGNLAISHCSKDYWESDGVTENDRFGLCINSTICGNSILGAAGNASWAGGGGDETKQFPLRLQGGTGFDFTTATAIFGDHFQENNYFFDGTEYTTSIVDNDGDVHTITDGLLTTQTERDSIDDREELFNTWIDEARAAAAL